MQMLISGDLIRVPQNTILYSSDDDSWRLHVTKKPDYGIVIESQPDKVKILLDGNLWIAKEKEIKLVGEKDVYKTV